MSHSTETIPKNQSSSAKGAEDLWQAIRTIISLQNQAPPLVSVSRQQELPLSFTQERLWLLDQLESGSAAYNIPFALRLRGALNIGALEQSIREIVRRHEALRTTFTMVDNKPIQVIASEDQNWSLTVQKLHDLPKAERESEVLRLSVEEAQQPFDLSNGPLWRASLLELAPEEHVLLLNFHHIVFDGWSEGLVWRELALLYEAFCGGQPSPLPELPVQYADFAVWQRQWLQGKFLEALVSYWQKQLGNDLCEIQLPTDKHRPAVPTRRSASQKLILPSELTKSLKLLSRQEGATLFATLLSTFKVLLHRYTEQERLFVCSPIANRNRSELKNLIGYFVNLLILQSDLGGNLSFRELLTQVRQTVSGAYAHQDLPLQQLINYLGMVQAPLSQVMFVLQNTNRTVTQLSGLTVEELEVDNGTADFDLSLSVTESADTLIGVWKYNTDLFAPETISTMVRHWQEILEAAVANPDLPLTSLLVLSKTESKQLAAKKAVPAKLTLPQPAKTKVQPRNALEFRLQELWKNILDIEHISIKDNFFELGGSSLLAFRLIAEIENSFGKQLPLSTLLQAPTIMELAKVISQESGSVSSSWLNPRQPDSNRPTLFCIPPAGNSLLGFANLVRHLGSDQPFYVPQPLGLEGETVPHDRVEDMAAHYIKEIRAIQPEGPYFLGGRCFGGIVAFEMALQLSQQGQKVALLALIDGGMPPNLYSKFRNVDGTKKTKSLAEYLQSLVYFWQRGQFTNLLKYKYEQKVRKLKAKFSKAPQEPLMQNVQRVFQSHMKARSNYVPQGVYPGKITIYASDTLRLDQQEGWNELAAEGVDIQLVGGSHGTIDREPYVRILAAKLRASINEQLAKSDGVKQY